MKKVSPRNTCPCCATSIPATAGFCNACGVAHNADGTTPPLWSMPKPQPSLAQWTNPDLSIPDHRLVIHNLSDLD